MSRQSIKRRLKDLENKTDKEGYLLFWQDLKDDRFCFVRSVGQFRDLLTGSEQGERLTWADAEARYSGRAYAVIKVVYEKDYRGALIE